MINPENDSEEIQEFISYVSKGVDLETASHASGLPVNLVFTWLERGKVEDERISGTKLAAKKNELECLALWRYVRKSRGKAIAKAQIAVVSAEDPKWQAWWLERSVPNTFAKASEQIALKEIEAGE